MVLITWLRLAVAAAAEKVWDLARPKNGHARGRARRLEEQEREKE